MPHDPLQQFLNSLTYDALTIGVWLMIVAMPVIVALTVRFLWYRHVYVGRSAELEKLIFQLHRIASALEQQQASGQQSETPAVEPVIRPIPLSMFGR